MPALDFTSAADKHYSLVPFSALPRRIRMGIEFEWDPAKAEANVRKHGISFEEATTAFFDKLSFTIPDPLHSEDEARFVLLGQTSTGQLIVVVHVDRGARIRLISARPATRKERRQYETNQ
jgi:uncharacterized DUF497 family protein